MPRQRARWLAMKRFFDGLRRGRSPALQDSIIAAYSAVVTSTTVLAMVLNTL